MKKLQRRLAAVMFTDMVGYSAMMQKDESIANQLRERHREVFTSYTKAHDGEILQYFGDGTLSIYPSAAAAVECAVDIQKELKKDPPVALRIGIHTGDVSYSDEDVFGDGVNVASRIESLCVPGGIFISAKTYDDIKNHTRLRAVPLGKFSLKNIHDQMEIYAVSNQGITIPDRSAWAQSQAQAQSLVAAAPKPVVRKKTKTKAGWLALFFGMFGVHRFYLGQRDWGMVYLGITLAAMFVLPSWLEFLKGLMAMVGVVDAILFWTMSQADFDEKFNPEVAAVVAQQTQVAAAQATAEKSFLKLQFENAKAKGLKEYREYDFAEAIEAFTKAAEIKNDDPEIHFLLACAYSQIEQAEKALLHLDAAVAFGLETDRVVKSEALAYLRLQPIFEAFAENGYRLPKPTPAQKEEAEPENPDLLEQLNRLHKLRKAGDLEEEDYQKLKTAARRSFE